MIPPDSVFAAPCAVFVVAHAVGGGTDLVDAKAGGPLFLEVMARTAFFGALSVFFLLLRRNRFMLLDGDDRRPKWWRGQKFSSVHSWGPSPICGGPISGSRLPRNIKKLIRRWCGGRGLHPADQ